eukprot:1516083-Rhodomonas_salina.4
MRLDDDGGRAEGSLGRCRQAAIVDSSWVQGSVLMMCACHVKGRRTWPPPALELPRPVDPRPASTGCGRAMAMFKLFGEEREEYRVPLCSNRTHACLRPGVTVRDPPVRCPPGQPAPRTPLRIGTLAQDGRSLGAGAGGGAWGGVGGR